jgi:enterochelin esterase-like enzyme
MKSFQPRFIFITVLLILSGMPAISQKLPSGPQVLTIFSNADDTEQPYGLYLPKNYDPQKKYPLVIMLHGAGSNHRLSLRRVFGKSNINGETDVEATRYFPEWKAVEYIVASPYARGTAGYQGVPEQDVYDVLADVKKRFSVDEDRTYLTGLSMGGGGTLWIAMTRPDIWAAIAPVCPAPPKGTDDLIGNALNLPAHFFHGDVDQAVPVTVSRDWTKKLKELGSHVEYIEYPGVNHDSWVNAYKDEFIFDWFSKFKRNPLPDRVRFSTTQYKYNKAYWVTFDKLTPGTLANIDAKFTAPNQLEIATTALDAFTLQLKGHAQLKSGQPVQVTINGKKIKTAGGETLSFTQQDGKWSTGKYEAAATAKKQGAEGPIRETFASRHIYVYGTAGNPSEAELKARRDIATAAADWSFYRGSFLGRIMFFPRILADKEVRPSDLESSNLILFGTKETNLLIDKYKDRLPLHLNASVSDHGLFYVMPVDGHYVAVSSGLPWWTGPQEQNYRFPPSYAEVPNLKDFVLFKGTLKNIIAEGYFDQNWKLPEAENKKIVASGATEAK